MTYAHTCIKTGRYTQIHENTRSEKQNSEHPKKTWYSVGLHGELPEESDAQTFGGKCCNLFTSSDVYVTSQGVSLCFGRRT
jgi:hypothetical protein